MKIAKALDIGFSCPPQPILSPRRDVFRDVPPFLQLHEHWTRPTGTWARLELYTGLVLFSRTDFPFSSDSRESRPLSGTIGGRPSSMMTVLSFVLLSFNREIVRGPQRTCSLSLFNLSCLFRRVDLAGSVSTSNYGSFVGGSVERNFLRFCIRGLKYIFYSELLHLFLGLSWMRFAQAGRFYYLKIGSHL